MNYGVHFSKKAQRDFGELLSPFQEQLLTKLIVLKTNPFPDGKRVKKIRGTKASLYRLRTELPDQSYRVFYSILKPNIVMILRIVPKKTADRIIHSLARG